MCCHSIDLFEGSCQKKTSAAVRYPTDCAARRQPNGTHFVNFEPQCASMRAGFPNVFWPCSPHASALRLNVVSLVASTLPCWLCSIDSTGIPASFALRSKAEPWEQCVLRQSLGRREYHMPKLYASSTALQFKATSIVSVVRTHGRWCRVRGAGPATRTAAHYPSCWCSRRYSRIAHADQCTRPCRI